MERNKRNGPKGVWSSPIKRIFCVVLLKWEITQNNQIDFGTVLREPFAPWRLIGSTPLVRVINNVLKKEEEKVWV